MALHGDVNGGFRLATMYMDTNDIPFSVMMIPVEWKKAHVSPIYKKGHKRYPGNYRPVSLMCKCMEGIVRNHLITYMEANIFLAQNNTDF